MFTQFIKKIYPQKNTFIFILISIITLLSFLFVILNKYNFVHPIISIIIIIIVTTYIIYSLLNKYKLIEMLSKNKLEQKKSQYLFTKTLNIINDGIFTIDANGIIKKINPSGQKFLQRNILEVINKKFDNIFQIYDKIAEKNLSNFIDNIIKYPDNQFLIKDAVLSSKNYNIHVSISATVINFENDVIGVIVVFEDISEDFNAKKYLLESEESFRALAENSYDTIIRFNKSGEHIYVNPMIEKLTDIPQNLFLGKTHRELGFPNYLCEMWDNAIQQVFETGEINRIEFPLPNGNWIDWLLMPEFDSDKITKTIITSARDITERKKIENQLEYFKNYLSDIINSMPSEIIGINSDGLINLWNNQIATRTGLSAEKIINSKADDILKKFNIKISTIHKCIKTGKQKLISKKEINENNKITFKNIIIYPLTISDIKSAVVRIDDITKQVQLEESLIQSEKMISLGGLALGMAHEINNPIAGMN